MIHVAVRALVGAVLQFASGSAAPSRDDVLSQPLAIHLDAAPLDQALRAVGRNAEVRLSFSSDLLPASVRVTIHRDRTTVGDVLRDILRGTELGFVVAGSGHIVILRALTIATPSARDARRDATVAAARSEAAPRVMDAVIVMGTPVAGAIARELTTAVDVVSAQQIRASHPTDAAGLFRSAVAGVVAWDLGVSGPVAQVGSVRGSSSFSENYLKTYLDGVELASPYMLFAIDPGAIDRLEVIQGPQGSALYGSDAISGVAHVITRKGTFGAGLVPHVEATASGGVVETQFAPQHPRAQHHVGAVEGGGTTVSYRVTGTRSENGAYVTDGHAGSTAILGTTRALAGPVLIEATARAGRIDFTSPVSPPLQRALGPRAVPFLARAVKGQRTNQETLGATAVYEPRDGWRHTFVAGHDRNSGALVPQRNPASVADVLLGASDEDARRASFRYSTSLRLQHADGIASTITGGLERSRLERERSGPISVIAPPSDITRAAHGTALYVDTIVNSAAFAQWKLALHDAVYLVAGARGDRNSSFGEGYGTAWSPMAGASYICACGAVTLKLRTAYGKGIRPPPPSARRALATQLFRQIANPTLAPESQAGVEAGFDLYAGDQLSLSVTGFDQRAEGLIQHVRADLRASPNAIQQQNVGRITNRGGDISAALSLGPMRADVGVAFVTSRVAALSKSYSGDLRVGDRLPEVPSSSGHAAISARLGTLNATAGLSFIGSWTGYDWLSLYAASTDSTRTLATLRSYWLRYPSTVRPYVVVSQSLAPHTEWFARVDNLTNRQRDTRDNLQITAGRTVWLGVTLSMP